VRSSLARSVRVPAHAVMSRMSVPGVVVAASLAAWLAAPLVAPTLGAQSAAKLSPAAQAYVSVSDPVVVLAHVTVLDGTGAPPRTDQTIVIRNGKIADLGPAASVQPPAGARVMDLTGQTVIPGIVGMHDHLFYNAAGGRSVGIAYTGPRLYLGSGVTTIRTTGTTAPYADINTKRDVDAGTIAGPRIHITAPYITGPAGGAEMAVLSSPEQARHFVAYWVSEGATWIKAYTDIRRAELAATITEAHRRGIKVTGHLCSVSYREAVDLGIDNLEHGFFTATDFDPQHKPDVCPAGTLSRVGGANPSDDTARAVIKKLVDHKVPMTSTLAVLEPFFPHRPVTDPRTLETMAPEVRDAYLAMRAKIDSDGTWPFTSEKLKNAMTFEKEFVDAGGMLAAGVDPTGIGGALPGFGDQRNYELLIEAGLTPVQTVQVMTANGAKILGVYDKLGSVERGKLADLVVLNGDLTADPSTIHKVTTVFKDGVGYDSGKLITAAKGRVGID
jgi:imidazolonepropionase-like amidohydrolase